MKRLDITLRLEEPRDCEEVERLTRRAFWDVYKPGCDEHLIVHQLHASPALVRELNYVAEAGGKLVGNIVYSKARVEKERQAWEVLCMGPISVLPGYQRGGVGSMLLRHTIRRARELGYPGIILFGSPQYYSRFGFVDARKFDIRTGEGENFPAFMALELREGGFAGVRGRFHEDAAFSVNPADLEKFDRKFAGE